MKKILFAGLALAMLNAAAFAQGSKSNYSDDTYYHGSQAEKDADQQAQAMPANQQYDSAAYYNSSGNGYYNNTNNNQVYNQNAYDSDGYIDYNDDYTTRIRRFYYPMSGVGYWGSVYDPFWDSPYYGWGNSWYTPGFSFSWGWNPFWSNNWGWNYGYGFGWNYSPYYGGFYNPYNPYYGWGGYGMGYWNGYYDGLYNGWNYGANNRRNYTYAPRGARSSGTVRNTGMYGATSRTSAINRTNNTVTPQRGNTQIITPNSRLSAISTTTNAEPQREIQLGNTRVYNNNDLSSQGRTSMMEMNRNDNSSAASTEPQSRFSGNNANTSNSRTYQRNDNYTTPSRSYSPPARTEQSAPTRSYSPPARSYSPAPSRSYSPPARSSGGSSSRSFRR